MLVLEDKTGIRGNADHLVVVIWKVMHEMEIK